MEEVVILVDEKNNEIRTAPKDTVHTKNTPLHRGFSLFLFNGKGELLLTKRAQNKTFPGLWTNTVCGHPGPGESAVAAAKRRLKQELGIETQNIKEVSPYQYRFVDANGIVENEICPILVAYADMNPQPNQEEIDEWRWMRWEEFLIELKKKSQKYSPWCMEEVVILQNQKISLFNTW